MEQHQRILAKYMPGQAAQIIAGWIKEHQVQVKITRKRKTKLGDYRHPFRGLPHRISVNHDLNPYAFLITMVHEFAHLLTWNKHQNKVLPHGKEWKQHFQHLMAPLLNESTFPDDVLTALSRYLRNPAASSCTDLTLMNVLKKHDVSNTVINNLKNITQIPEGELFEYNKGRIFKKGTKLRKRYSCTEVATGRIYLFSPLAEVKETGTA